MIMTVAEAMVRCLEAEGVKQIFGYPGATICPFYDALSRTDIRHVLVRTEQNAGHAANGYARMTGKPGVCVVTSGPGATNLITGISTAYMDSIPLVVITGQVVSSLLGSDVFQEVDITGSVEAFIKHSYLVKDPSQIARVMKEAFYIARTGKPGPVLVDLPKDVQNALGPDEYPAEVAIRGYKPSTGVHMGQLKKAAAMLEGARRPLFLLGGGVLVAGAGKAMTALAERLGVPVVTTIMGKGALPADHPLYIGNMGMHGNVASNTAVSECDLLFSIGTRFNDRITGKIEDVENFIRAKKGPDYFMP